MSTKAELQEEVAELTAALGKMHQRLRLERQENRRLRRAFERETMRFARLESYIKTLREWAEGSKHPTTLRETGEF